MPAAVAVSLADGTVDYLVFSTEPSAPCRARGISWAGRIGFLRTKGGKVVEAALIEGTRLGFADLSLQMPQAAITGTVTDFSRGVGHPAFIWTDAPLDGCSGLRGCELYVEAAGPGNPAYRICDIQRDGHRWRIDCGETDFVLGFKDRSDYSKGFVYEISVGQRLRIPCHVAVRRQDGQWHVVSLAGPPLR